MFSEYLDYNFFLGITTGNFNKEFLLSYLFLNQSFKNDSSNEN